MLELDVFLHSWSDFSVSVINANLAFQLNKITSIGVSLFQPNSFPLLVSKEKKLVNLSAHDGQADKKICQLRKRICQHGANKNFGFKSREQVGIIMHCTLEENEMLKTNSNGKWTRIGNLYTNPQDIINAAEKVSTKLAKLGHGSSVRP